MIVWDWIKNRRPVDISIKKRRDGNIMIIYGKQLEISYLNKTGSYILELSNGRNTVAEIANKLLEVYDVDALELQSDITDLIRELQWKRLIRLEEA